MIKMTEEITGTESLIEKICKKYIYYKKVCWFDYGDSVTKIPCQALKVLYELCQVLEIAGELD